MATHFGILRVLCVYFYSEVQDLKNSCSEKLSHCNTSFQGFFFLKEEIYVCVYISSHVDPCKTYSQTHMQTHRHSESWDSWPHNLVTFVLRYIVVTVIY